MSNTTKIELKVSPKKPLCTGTLKLNDVFRVRASGNVYVVTQPAIVVGDKVVAHCLVEGTVAPSTTFGYNFSDILVASKVEVQFD
ncbi:hypothetical protein [Aeromonas phage phiA014S]|uniref:Uncharacterized protein n=1 Tax=Aeromonas phage phiA014S TaxID=3119845 RepID=A0ABZ2CLZ0_9CAUD